MCSLCRWDANNANQFDKPRQKIRVFNEDFVRDNLRFITNPDDNIESFAILGEDNNKIEQEIGALEKELGAQEQGEETGLYAQRAEIRKEYVKHKGEHKQTFDALEKQLSDKATDRNIGIKYKPERFGDQNYNVTKLKTEIEEVLKPSYQPSTGDQLSNYEKLIAEKILQPVSPFCPSKLQFGNLANEAEILITKKISESDKIEELAKDAVLNRWVSEGRSHHKGKKRACGFCGSAITTERWEKLEKHFDEESSKLEKDLDVFLNKIETEKNSTSLALSIFDRAGLLGLLQDLYAANKDNQTFLHARLSVWATMCSSRTKPPSTAGCGPICSRIRILRSPRQKSLSPITRKPSAKRKVWPN
ncbi:AAA family ATPase [Candidatus Nitrotoga sp. AM1P]|uniref:AAA family ATPase n=1 Tax=Candidatus Nitrotoga sp. AM1P TaxID=2559597 RepID=UPI0010B673F2|nr:AAA family ATPase [Candidatus Nitrotoga sp. AM1P]BBJ22104.1 hypothetical protein W01_00310 [Candidatus Nitrotoga sp. AM1P]